MTVATATATAATESKLYALDSAGNYRLRLHPGQYEAWESVSRFTFIFAGTQSGKTSYLPWWLAREIQRCGPGDYIAATGSYDLFKLKFLPAMREVFEHALGNGKYWAGDRIIEIADPATGKFWATRADDPMYARIILRSAESDSGLESSTAKAAVLDEAGMDSFTVDTWRAVLRRLSLSQGRVLGGTTVYNLGWVKTEIYDKWKAGDPDYKVVQFDSTENPAFPVEEFERARRDLPDWLFNQMYRGLFERPAGLIYDSFDEERHVIRPFAIAPTWPRYLGLDFGGVNTAGLFYANEPGTPRLYLYREYKAGNRTLAEHATELLRGEPMIPRAIGGSHSEDQWRKEAAQGGVVDNAIVGGLPVGEPDIKDVDLGITRVYGAHKRDEILVFNTCTGYLKEKRSYSRKVGLDGLTLPTGEIENKHAFHFMDAERYIVGWLKRGAIVSQPRIGGHAPAQMPIVRTERVPQRSPFGR